MTEEEFVQIMESEQPDSDSKSDIFDGLVIMRKYLPNANIAAAEHDEVYGPDIDDLVKAGITEEDAKALRSLNWMIDDDETCVRHFA